MADKMGDAAALERLLAGRHSCRGFRPDPVPRETIERMLAMAGRTASWCNAQPWQVVVLSGAATDRFRDALQRDIAEAGPDKPDIAFPPSYEGAALARRRECGFQLYEAVGVVRGDRVGSARQMNENFRLFGAPHALIVTADASLGPYGAIDCGGYVATLLLAAESLGLGAIAQAALAMRSGFVRRHLDLPDGRQVVCGVSFGFEDKAHPANGFRTSRAPADEVVSWREG
jgi:nitroreductase